MKGFFVRGKKVSVTINRVTGDGKKTEVNYTGIVIKSYDNAVSIDAESDGSTIPTLLPYDRIVYAEVCKA